MTPEPQPVRVRFAPSPTGELHLGSARTALYDLLLARRYRGQLILRIDDTDQQRYVPGSMDRLMADLKWLGIEMDEGPEQGGPVGPYVQTQRTDYYRDIARQLQARDAAYVCFCTQERLREVRDAQQARGEQPRYDRQCRTLSSNTVAQKQAGGLPYVLRLKVPEHGSVTVHDLVRGEITFDLATIDDQVLVKSNGLPTYHLATVADDHAMAISHVIRAEEWLPSTPKHLLLYQAMAWTPPLFAHLPLVLATDRTKLSKRRHGEAVWISTYRTQGYLPEAMVNYLALLGWNPGGDREFFTLSELVRVFSLERVHRAGAIFDQAKLDAFQAHYVRELSPEELVTRLGSYLDEQGLSRPSEPVFGRMVAVVHERLGRFADFPRLTTYLNELPDYPAGRLVFKRSSLEPTTRGLAAAALALGAAESAVWESRDALTKLLQTVVAKEGFTNGDVFWPVRVALSGENQSASPAECLWVLGREESLYRLAAATSKLQIPNPN